MANIGSIFYDAGKPAEALANYEKARDLNAAVVDSMPTSLDLPTNIGQSQNSLRAVKADLARDYYWAGFLLANLDRS